MESKVNLARLIDSHDLSREEERRIITFLNENNFKIYYSKVFNTRERSLHIESKNVEENMNAFADIVSGSSFNKIKLKIYKRALLYFVLQKELVGKKSSDEFIASICNLEKLLEFQMVTWDYNQNYYTYYIEDREVKVVTKSLDNINIHFLIKQLY